MPEKNALVRFTLLERETNRQFMAVFEEDGLLQYRLSSSVPVGMFTEMRGEDHQSFLPQVGGDYQTNRELAEAITKAIEANCPTLRIEATLIPAPDASPLDATPQGLTEAFAAAIEGLSDTEAQAAINSMMKVLSSRAKAALWMDDGGDADILALFTPEGLSLFPETPAGLERGSARDLSRAMYPGDSYPAYRVPGYEFPEESRGVELDRVIEHLATPKGWGMYDSAHSDPEARYLAKRLHGMLYERLSRMDSREEVDRDLRAEMGQHWGKKWGITETVCEEVLNDILDDWYGREESLASEPPIMSA